MQGRRIALLLGASLALGLALWQLAGRGPGCPPEMALIPGGAFTVGQLQPSEPWHEPARDVQLASFCMDRYEHPNQAGREVTVDVSWTEAVALCQEQGKRLCSSAEWERACRGPQRWRYVYGDQRRAEACNAPLEEPDPSRRQPALVAGAYPDCVSQEGVYDLNGSVSEWVQDAWTGPRAQVDQRYPADETSRMLRGGTLWRRTHYGQDCTSRHGHPSSAKRGDDGLRCCKDTS